MRGQVNWEVVLPENSKLKKKQNNQGTPMDRSAPLRWGEEPRNKIKKTTAKALESILTHWVKGLYGGERR